MSDVTTYIHFCVTAITTISTIVLSYFSYRDKRLTKELATSEQFHNKINELETNVKVLQERSVNNKEEINKILNIMLEKRKDNE